jgi:TRAP-type mannitol/chloroaromatic compound transport system permease small subunit
LNFLKAIGNFITRVNYWIARVASFLIYPIILVICFEVFCRYVLNSPTIYTYDLTWMSYGALIFLGGAYALAYDVHVKADILYNMMNKWGKMIINLVCYPAFFFTSLYAFLGSSYVLMRNAWAYHEISRYTSWGPPTGPVKTVLFVSFVMLAIQGVVKFIQLIGGTFKKEVKPE